MSEEKRRKPPRNPTGRDGVMGQPVPASKHGGSKRQSAGEEGLWECSMCTYRNPPEFFKCEICECRKGTSTRRPRVTSSQIVAQQVAQSYLQPPLKKERKEKKERRERTDRVELNQSVSSVGQEVEATDDGEPEVLEELPETKPEAAVSQEDSVEGEREEPDIPESQPSEYVPPPAPPKLKKEASTSKLDRDTPTHSTKCTTTKKSKSSRLKNIDRSSGQSMEVTVNNITVVITDYQLKKENGKVTNASAASAATVTNSERLNSSITQQALQERDGESKDSFSSSITDNLQSGGEGDHPANSTVPSAIVES